MKKLLFAVGLILASCSSGEETEVATEEISIESQEEMNKSIDANVELEKLDGELDSLLNTF